MEMLIPNLLFWGGVAFCYAGIHCLQKAKDSQDEAHKIWKQILKDAGYSSELSVLTAVACEELRAAIGHINRHNIPVAQFHVARLNTCIEEMKRLDKVTPTE